MIKKISKIRNLAVFKDFDWDTNVLDGSGQVKNFEKVNIIYGRNYSGKTTLSRILRAIEIGNIPEKYDNAEFEICFTDQSSITNFELHGNAFTVRVFNEDFIADNLQFIHDPDAAIEPFLVALGEENIEIEKKIEELENELGSNLPDNETGLYKMRVTIDTKKEAAERKVTQLDKELNELLRNKATDSKNGIKYKVGIFGDQNYDIKKLKKDINFVLNDYELLGDSDIEELKLQLREQPKIVIQKSVFPKLNYKELAEAVNAITSKEIGESNKISELIKDTTLNLWVKEGYSKHKGKRNSCAFCNSIISDKRWEELEQHFDEDSRNLEKRIDKIREELETYKQDLNQCLKIDKTSFYVIYHNSIDELSTRYDEEIQAYLKKIDYLLSMLGKRKNNITKAFNIDVMDANIDALKKVWADYEKIREKSNGHTSNLSKSHKDIQEKLRLNEVASFIKLINYKQKIEAINSAKGELEKENKAKKIIENDIEDRLQKIQMLKARQKDEEKGVLLVNYYLNDFFGNNFLSLHAIDDSDGEETKIKFEVLREGEKAFYLSEGEKRLVAFSYFLARLSDIETEGNKPIIWIDDPISSLDGNHIFAVYSVIASEIIEKDAYEQIFISTHSLEFLKYLRRINGKFYERDKECSKLYLLISRTDEISTIELMPKYLKEYATEFNYLFHQIYQCSKIDRIDDSNYTQFYNFGNNARKFLEIYLYYKYPCEEKDREKMERFFGEGKVPPLFIERISNEYSHLKGKIESASMPVEVPEMQKVAKLIMRTIEQKDKQQYIAFLKSIGEEYIEG